ncbi:unnamed protein product [Arctogadus glacialis]
MEGERCVALPPQWEDGGAADRASPTSLRFTIPFLALNPKEEKAKPRRQNRKDKCQPETCLRKQKAKTRVQQPRNTSIR